MPFCGKCGNHVKYEDNFCKKCGNNVQRANNALMRSLHQNSRTQKIDLILRFRMDQAHPIALTEYWQRWRHMNPK